MVLIATVSPSSADAEHALDTRSHVGLPVRTVAGGAGGGGAGGGGGGGGDGSAHRSVVGGACADWQGVGPCGARVLTRRLQGRASLMRGEVAGSVDVDRPLPPSPRDWTSAEVVRWWLATSTAAVERINAEVAEAAAAGFAAAEQKKRRAPRCRGGPWPDALLRQGRAPRSEIAGGRLASSPICPGPAGPATSSRPPYQRGPRAPAARPRIQAPGHRPDQAAQPRRRPRARRPLKHIHQKRDRLEGV